MPFKNTDELADMVAKDPEMAKSKVLKAKKKKLPIVDENNPGYKKYTYRSKAITNRMRAVRGREDTPVQPTMSRRQAKAAPEVKQKAIEYRMASFKKNEPKETEENKLVAKRKKVGY